MTDVTGQQDIRGINIDTLAKGFADEDLVITPLVTVLSTNARENRWFQKTAGFLTGTTTTGITSSLGYNIAEKTAPSVIEPSYTRNTSYVLKFMFDSPLVSVEDIQDSTPDVLGNIIRDVTRAVGYQKELHIWNVMTESQSPSTINYFATTSVGGDQWDAASYAGNPIADINRAIRLIRDYSYNVEGNGFIIMNPQAHEILKTWLIAGKGSSIPNFSSTAVQNGVVMQILGLDVIVSTQATADYALVGIRKKAVTYYEFSPMNAQVIRDGAFTGIGVKFRCWTNGVAVLTDPKALCLITDILT